MHQLFHVACTVEAPLMLELQNGSIRCVEDKPLPPFVTRYQLVLAEPRLADFLLHLDIPRLRIESVVVHSADGGEIRTHHRVRVGQYFTPAQVRDLNLDGDRLLTMNDEYLFVNESLKRKLREAGFEYLRFSEGLSEFAADAT